MANENRIDLIDRAKVYERACVGCTRHGEFPGECYHDEPCEKLIFAFTVAEPVDAVEVVHGRWVYHECVSSHDGAISGYSCSECNGFVNEEVFDMDEFHKDFCGHCGAKMDGDRNE